jgi:hypothetical protein
MTDRDLDIEPDEPAGMQGALVGEVVPGVTIEYRAGAYLPENFPLTTLLRFMPDVRLKQRVLKAADEAKAVDISAEGGLAKADAARARLLDAIKAAKEPFNDPVSLANQLHKRLTGLRGDFTGHGEEVAEDVGKAIIAEERRLKRLAEEQRRRDQEKADEEARQRAEQLAKDAAKRKAPTEVVELLKHEAKTAAAPPVSARAYAAPLSKSTTVEKWKGRFVGTEDDAEVNPDMADLTPAQQESAREFFLGIAKGEVPLACGAINWTEINRKAHAERSTFLVAGMEAIDVGGLRSKSKR